MSKKIDFTFQTQKTDNHFQLASGYISETNILFEEKNVIVNIHAKGDVTFYNTNDELLAFGKLPEIDSGKKVYQEIECKVNENLIILEFPLYNWIDNYPNCDGEYDRWETRKIGQHTITFDTNNNKIL